MAIYSLNDNLYHCCVIAKSLQKAVAIYNFSQKRILQWRDSTLQDCFVLSVLAMTKSEIPYYGF
ncbi:hypothetical protein, partial [Helicobacter sp. MIT 05-5294]|uniref:hypothetical protein n=1 Tax=Helicobacter sp. MIT 05-5294 TaxID=1548150 RepID=UPI0010FEA004